MPTTFLQYWVPPRSRIPVKYVEKRNGGSPDVSEGGFTSLLVPPCSFPFPSSQEHMPGCTSQKSVTSWVRLPRSPPKFPEMQHHHPTMSTRNSPEFWIIGKPHFASYSWNRFSLIYAFRIRDHCIATKLRLRLSCMHNLSGTQQDP